MTIRLTPTITLYQRRDWGARLWKDFTKQTEPTEGFIHHSTDRLAEYADTLAEQKAIMRAIQRYHMDSNGWSDIAYHALVFQPYGHRKYARVFEGRPISHVPAAQFNHNRGSVAVCVVGNFQGDDQVKTNTRHAIEVFLGTIPGLATLGGHRDVTSTTCPGDTLYNQIGTIASASHLHMDHKRMNVMTAPLVITGQDACGSVDACGTDNGR